MAICLPWSLTAVVIRLLVMTKVAATLAPAMDAFKGLVPRPTLASPRGDLIRECKQHYRNTTLDHFSWVRSAVLLSEMLLPDNASL